MRTNGMPMKLGAASLRLEREKFSLVDLILNDWNRIIEELHEFAEIKRVYEEFASF
jgi:hypothetical protein